MAALESEEKVPGSAEKVTPSTTAEMQGNHGELASDRLHFLGWAITLLYSFVVVHLGWGRWSGLSELPLNELGDVFAGVAAPLAFIWLVLGFYQQGTELRNSTRAIQLQVSEMQENSAHQRSIADTGKAVMLAEHLPRLGLKSKELSSSDGYVYVEFYLRNVGGYAESILIDWEGREYEFAKDRVESLSRGETVSLGELKFTQSEEFSVQLVYADAFGTPHQKVVKVCIDRNSDGLYVEVVEHGDPRG